MSAQAGTAEPTRRELRDQVLVFIRRRVPSDDDAEDIAQEVMLRIYRHSADLEHEDRMTAWVYRIATNAIADHFRRPARRELPAGQSADVPEHDCEPPAAALLEPEPEELRRELAACLSPLIEKLSPTYREAIELVEFDGVSQVEAAARLGITVSGAKARVQRARQQLRELLLACCEVELDRRRSVTAINARGKECGSCASPSARPTG
jgi:RNA polymerase sigma-70 factor (ECF subfamily)